jgi:hypothetical protein
VARPPVRHRRRQPARFVLDRVKPVVGATGSPVGVGCGARLPVASWPFRPIGPSGNTCGCPVQASSS